MAALAAVACVAVYVPVLRGNARHFEIPAAEVAGRLPVIRAMAIGTMMYAQVDRQIWQGLQEPERIARVTELAESAVVKGFETLYLTDENSQDLASWSQGDGVKLATKK